MGPSHTEQHPIDHRQHIPPGVPQDAMDAARLAYRASIANISPAPGSAPSGAPISSPHAIPSPRSAPPTPRMGNHQTSPRLTEQQVLAAHQREIR